MAFRVSACKAVAVSALSVYACAGLLNAQDTGSLYAPSTEPVQQSVQSTVPRSISYGTVMQNNIAKENTTNDLLTRQYLLDDQFVTGEYGAAGASGSAAISFKALGFNWFGSARTTGAAPNQSAEIVAGVGKTDAFGVGLVYDLANTNDENLPATPNTKHSTNWAPAGVGVIGSMNIGFGGIYGGVKMYTDPAFSRKTEVTPPGAATTTTTADNSRTEVSAGWLKSSDAEREHSLGIDLNVAMESHVTKTDPGGAKTVDNSSLDVVGVAHYGIPLAKKENYVVLVGSDLGVAMISTKDDMTLANPKKTETSTIWVEPNVAFQRELGAGFEMQAGASARFAELIMGSSTNNANAESKTGSVFSEYYNVLLGLSWVHENLRVEGRINPALLANGPNVIAGSVNPMFASVGLVLGF
jgi:hypothetical protein